MILRNKCKPGTFVIYDFDGDLCLILSIKNKTGMYHIYWFNEHMDDYHDFSFLRNYCKQIEIDS